VLADHCEAAQRRNVQTQEKASLRGRVFEDLLGYFRRGPLAGNSDRQREGFDGARLRDWTSVRFADGIVTDCATGSMTQDGDEVIDAEGGTILPGLWPETRESPSYWRTRGRGG
jgi:imidazolonepropionase-like amidohydrolase